MLLPQGFERLDEESAFREPEAGLLQGSVFECKTGASDLVRTVWAIRSVDGTCGHLRGEADQVLGNGSARLDSPPEFAREGLCHLVGVRAQFRREQFTEPGKIIDTANDPANRTFTLQPVERRVDSRAAPEIGKVSTLP